MKCYETYFYTNRWATYGLSGNMGRAISDFQKAYDMGYENRCTVKYGMTNRDFMQDYEKHLNLSKRQGVSVFAERMRRIIWKR